MSVFCDHRSDTCVHKSQRISRVTVSLRIMTLYIGVNFVFVAIYVLSNKAQVFFVLGAIIEGVFFNHRSEHGSFVAQEACIRRDNP